MANPPELWTFTLANVISILLATILTTLSFFAYHSNGYQKSFRDATLGFGFLTIGLMIEPAYQLGIKQSAALEPRELLALQSLEGLFLSLGLALLFYSIYLHNTTRDHTHLTHIDTDDTHD